VGRSKAVAESVCPEDREGVMNHSIYGADRLTHIKIVVVALIAATVVAGVGIAARDTGTTSGIATAGNQDKTPVIRAGQPVVVGEQANSAIR
jgi:hypothetical protein